MRKLMICVLMMTFLLIGCKGGTAGISEAEELALSIRTEYIEMTACQANVTITADYGQRVYQYGLTAAVNGEETVLTLTAPETVAGITARLSGEENLLEYDDVIVETGPLNEEGLSPVSALPVLLECAKSGFITATTFETVGEQEILRVMYGDPEEEAGTGTETSLWFDKDSHILLEGEVSVDGLRVILCEFSQFVMG